MAKLIHLGANNEQIELNLLKATEEKLETRSKINLTSVFLLIVAIFVFLSLCYRDASAQVRERIIGGTNASKGEFPFMALILFHDANAADPLDGLLCGGTLIAPQYVLTAGHCGDYMRYKDPTGASFDVIVGRTKRSSSDGVRVQVAGIIVHPLYDGYYLRNDVALLKLAAPVPGPVVPLVGAGDDNLWKAGIVSTILGWGMEDPTFAVLPDNLQKAQIPIQSDQACSDNLGMLYDSNSQICAGKLATSSTSNDGIDTCYGDSGGPLLIPNGSAWKQAGITSWGFQCASAKFYAVYTRVANYSAWVYSFPPVAPYNLIYPIISGSPTVGKTLTCDKGVWGGDSAVFTYQWSNDNGVISGATNPIYTLTAQDQGNYITCIVTGTNSSGTASNYSDSAGPVAAAPVILVVPDTIPPTTTIASASCKKRSCTVVVDVDDGQTSSGIARVEGYSIFQGTASCKTKKNPSCTKKVVVPSLADAVVQNANTYVFAMKSPGVGRYRMWVRATDVAGNRQTAATFKAFKVIGK